MAELLSFTWSRHTDGYDWVVIKGDLVTLDPVGRHTETYKPLEDERGRDVLFQIFAYTPDTPAGIRQFANTWGLLDDGGSLPLGEWRGNIRAMRFAIDMWRDHEFSQLADYFSGLPISKLSPVLSSPNNQNPTLSFSPLSLMDALWLQFAQAVAGRKRIKQCLHCQQPFVHGTGTRKRSTAKYCSIKHQKAHEYLRRKEASK